LPSEKVRFDLLNLSDRPVMTSLQSKNLRSCIDCRKRENPAALLRTVCIDGKILPDPHGTLPGRGAWVHRKCVVRAIQRGVFARAFRVDEVLDGGELIAFTDSHK
jgi:hypothetical protein